MKRISSRFTFFFKRVFPTFWFGFVAIFLVVMAFAPTFEDTIFVVASAVLMGLIGFFVFRMLIWDLVDTVHDGRDFLLVRNRGEEERIALSRIASVSEWRWMNPPRVTLTLAAPGKFGQQIAFLPEYRLKAPFASSPITLDLIARTRKP